MSKTPTIVPAIMCGGSGTRLWPLSRASYPKQFLPLAGEATLFQDTVARVAGAPFTAPMILCSEGHRFIAAQQLQEMGAAADTIILEPVGRNTAPAAAVAALLAAERHPDALVLLLASDHLVTDLAAYGAVVAKAAEAAAAGSIVLFGHVPHAPATGFGYIRQGDPLPGVDGAFRVAQFLEKPDAAKAEAMLAQGDHFWNGGTFMFRPDVMLAELERLRPTLLAQCREAVAQAKADMDFLRLASAPFEAIEGEAVDVAVMEQTPHAAVVPAGFDWDDLGSWSAVRANATEDSEGNATRGNVLAEDCTGSYLRAEDGPMIAALGLRDAMVVSTRDAVLVAPLARAQDVKRLVDRLKADNRSEVDHHVRVHRPWGTYETVDLGARYQVKQLMVLPGQTLSLQKHLHRAEHWVVVEGTAEVTRDDEVMMLAENQSVYIPLGAVHRLANRGKVPLRIIEVQSGSYLGEDDIIRFEDTYGRVPAAE